MIVITSEQSDRSNLQKYQINGEIAASILKNDCFFISPHNDSIKIIVGVTI